MQKKSNSDKNDENPFKLHHKGRDHCHYTGKLGGAANSICNLRYKKPKNFLWYFIIVLHMTTIIKQLAKEFDGQLKCLGENTEKHITFSVPI